MRVSRKLGMPLNRGLAARWRRTCRMPRRSSSKRTLSSTCAEYPGAAEAGAAYHDGIHAIAVEALAGALGGGDVAVAYDGDVHAGILLHGAYQRPVGLAGVHLCAGAPVDGEGPDAAVLQLFGKVDNDFMFGIPA